MKIKQLPVTLNVVDFGAVQGWWGRLLLALGGFMSVKVAPVQRSTDVTFHFSLIMTYWLRGGQPASLTKYYFPQWGSALTQTAVPWKEERDGVWRHFPFFQKAHYFNGTGKKKTSVFLAADLVLASLSVVINQVNAPDLSRSFIILSFTFCSSECIRRCSSPITHTLSHRPLCCAESCCLTGFTCCRTVECS